MLFSQGQLALALTEKLVTLVRAEVAERGLHAAKVLAASEVQELQVEDWQEKARTVGTVIEGLRSDLSLCRQQQDRLKKALRRRKQKLREQQEEVRG